MDQTYHRWEFIEKWLPDYYTNPEVTYFDDLDCYITGQTENSRYEELEEQFPILDDAIEEQDRVELNLFTEAFQHYAKRTEKTESPEYKLEVLRDLWGFFSSITVGIDDEIEQDFLDFKAGTSRLDVWSWFDEQCPNGVAVDLMFETSKTHKNEIQDNY